MFWTILCLGVGWLLGRNWDQVKKIAMDKIKASQNSSGKVTKID